MTIIVSVDTFLKKWNSFLNFITILSDANVH